MRHLENMNKVMLVTGMMVTYGYLMEHFIAWYSGNPYESRCSSTRAGAGPIGADLLADDLLQRRRAADLLVRRRSRTSIPVMWVASILVNIGMWCERFIIVVTSLHRDFLPSKWENYVPTWVDIGLFAGTIGLFSTLFLLFLKFVPAVAVTEVKELRHELAHDPRTSPAEETH